MSDFFTQSICEQVWENKYRNTKTNETLEEFYKRQAKALSKAGCGDFNDIYENLYGQYICLGGRIQYSLGTDYQKQTMSNCFTVRIAKDSMDEIMKTQAEFAKTMQAGGGVGCNFSILRPKGTSIKTTNGVTSGVVEFMKGFDAWCKTISAGNNRRGAMIGVLECWHPEIINFIKAKQTQGVLSSFNISVGITDAFMEAVENDKIWSLLFPDIFYKKYDEWDGNLDNWIKKGYPVDVYQTLPARELYDMILKANYEYAEPGVLFIDTININNNLWKQEDIRVTNPCGEQPLFPYNSCNLGAINLVRIVKEPFNTTINPIHNIDLDLLTKLASDGVRYLDAILDLNYYPLEKYKEQAMQKRAIGLGVMGFGSMLNMLGVTYGSKESLEIIDLLGETILNSVYNTSADLAKEKGCYPCYDPDEIFTGTTYKKLNEQTKIKIGSYGLRNSRLLTIAPTGSTAIVAQNVSGGLEPVFALEYTRRIREEGENYREEKVMDYSWWLYQKMFGTIKQEDSPEYFKAIASAVTPEQHIDVQSRWQYWIDASISKTINVPADISFDDFKDIYMSAWHKGLKGCTTYRPNNIVGYVLSTETNSKEDSKKNVGLKLGNEETCIRHRVKWKNQSNVYIVVTIDKNGNPLEVFSKLPKKAGNGQNAFNKELYLEFTSNWDAICRQVSISLRHGIPLDGIIKQLDSSSYSMFDCSAILARILKQYPYDFNNPKQDKAIVNEEHTENSIHQFDTTNICPECKTELTSSAGCLVCSNCGYSKCN